MSGPPPHPANTTTAVASATTPTVSVPIAALLLVALTLLAYAPALRAGYVWDDDAYVRRNPTLHSLTGLRQIWCEPARSPQYYPLVFTTFWVEYRLWETAPTGYHLTNICLHAANALLLWWLLRRLAVPAAFVAALVFALHPVHVESVAWMTERKDVLSGFFVLLTALAWLQFLKTRRARAYALTVAACLCALLSKTTAATLPFVLLLLSWWRGGRWRRDAGLLAPLLASAAALGVITVWRENLEAYAGSGLSPLARVLVAGRALWFYVGKLVYPAHLVTMYPRWEVDTAALLPFVFPLGAVAVVWILWCTRQRIGAGPFVAVATFILALAPLLGLRDFHFMRFAYVADHFQYLASIGLIALAVATIAGAVARLGAPRAGALLAGALVIVLILLTSRQAAIYRDEGALWRHTLANDPRAWGAHLYLGIFLAKQGDRNGALEHLRAAVGLQPDDAFARNTFGMMLAETGQLDVAAHQLMAAVELDPNDAMAQYNLGNVLFRQGARDAAARHFAAAIRAQPDLATAHNDLGVILFEHGDNTAALEHFAAAVRIDPNYAEAHNDLAMALQRAGDTARAIAHFRTAVRLKPDYAEAETNLAQALRADPAAADAAQD